MSSGVVADDIDESVEEGGTEEGEDDGVGSGEEVTDGNSDEATDDIDDDDDAGGSSLLVDAEGGLQGREREINNRLQWKYYTCGCLRFGPGTRRRP